MMKYVNLFYTFRIQLYFCFLMLLFVSCKNDNRKTFEDFTNVRIPKSSKIIKAEYQDMFQDNGILLVLQLNKKSKDEIISSIKISKFYNSDIFIVGNNINESVFVRNKNIKGIWYRDNAGYSFYGSTINERDNVTATIDTLKMTAKFQYLAD